jgi:hypothetical protein
MSFFRRGCWCDGTAVIGDMLARAARGQGFRSIAAAGLA